MTPFASARMYSWSPSLTAAWQRLLAWVSARSAVPLAVLAYPARSFAAFAVLAHQGFVGFACR